MERVDGRLIFSATDLINHLECPHLTHLNIEVALGRAELERSRSDTTDLVARKGDEHERDYLAQLVAEGREVVEIENQPGLAGTRRGAEPTVVETKSAPGLEDTLAGAGETVDAIKAGAEVIYQGVLFDGVRWRGHSDFLQRVESPSGLGPFSYEVADTKLARRVKPYFLLQLCFYSELVELIQGVAPERMHVVLGTRETETFRVAEFAAYYRSVKHGFEVAIDDAPAAGDPVRSGRSATYPEPVEHCALCSWEEHCEARREADDHLSLVARIQHSQRTRLAEQGIETLTQLAATEPADRPKRIGAGAFRSPPAGSPAISADSWLPSLILGLEHPSSLTGDTHLCFGRLALLSPTKAPPLSPSLGMGQWQRAEQIVEEVVLHHHHDDVVERHLLIDRAHGLVGEREAASLPGAGWGSRSSHHAITARANIPEILILPSNANEQLDALYTSAQVKLYLSYA